MAEYIVDITTQADRAGRADHFGDLYDASQLKAANIAELGSPAEAVCSGCCRIASGSAMSGLSGIPQCGASLLHLQSSTRTM